MVEPEAGAPRTHRCVARPRAVTDPERRRASLADGATGRRSSVPLACPLAVLPLLRLFPSLVMLAQSVSWQRPPAGTLRRGLWWMPWPRSTVAVVLVLTLGAITWALYGRLRRK
jgi:hypothetical protein